MLLIYALKQCDGTRKMRKPALRISYNGWAKDIVIEISIMNLMMEWSYLEDYIGGNQSSGSFQSWNT